MSGDITDLGHILTITAGEIYAKVLQKFGKKVTDKFLKDASQENKDLFIERLKKTQGEKIHDRLTLIMNRILTDYHFIKQYDEIMDDYKSLDELRQDNEIANNQLQSVENECSILQRDIDVAVDKLEKICEDILEQKYE
jgi:transposase-like protein